jgi:DNA-binding ferritin-like protein
MSKKDQIDQDVELDDEDEGLEEATHDPKNAEQKSAEAVAKTDDMVKKAPARKGDKSNSEGMKTNKSMMVNAIYRELMKKSSTDIASAYKNMFGEEVDLEALEEELDAKGELQSLVDDEGTLSEEFKDKASTLFETAVAVKVAAEIEQLEENYSERLDEEVAAIQEELVEKVDGYLNYVVENWMEENKLAIQSGLRAEIAEDFMKGLHSLFKESYVEVPEGKEDLVDELAERVASLEESLNETTADAIELAEQCERLERERIVLEASRDLADTQAEKLSKLAEGLDFSDPESFEEKVLMVKENYFPTEEAKETRLDEDFDDNEENDIKEVSPMMENYLSALKRTIK